MGHQASLTLRLFGQLAVLFDDRLLDIKSQKATAILAYLALRDRPQSRDSLATLLWPEVSQTRARANLRRTLWTLNQTPAGRWVVGTAEHVALLPDSLTIDAATFDDLLRTSSQDPLQLEMATHLYGGDLLADFSLPDCGDFEIWLSGERASYRRRAMAALHTLAEHRLRAKDFDAARRLARRQIAMDNLHEPAYRQLFCALAASGQRTTALHEYATLRAVLRAELSAEPSQQTTALIERIRSDRFAATVEPSATAVARTPPALPVSDHQAERSFAPTQPLACPYRGLLSFREEDASSFFGREELVSQLLMAVQQRPFTAFIGPSGAGKTSAIHAGLIPALRRRGDWIVVSTRPGSRPFHALAASLLPCLAPNLGNTEQLVETRRLADALLGGQISLLDVLERITHRPNAGQPRHFLLVVDRFDEVFSPSVDRATRQRFIDALLGLEPIQPRATPPQFVVIAALRADFLGQALAHRSLTSALHGANVMLGPMTRAELTRAVVNPAHLQHVEFEPGLVERILSDVGAEAGNLPLLEFALAVLWERQEAGQLTHAAYEAIGGVGTALAQHAETVIAGLTPEDQALARRIFMQLIRPGDDTGDTSRTATASELGAKAWHLATRLADSRLLATDRDTSGQATAEIIHVALVHHWSRLCGWIEEDRAFRLWQERLRTAMNQWEDQQRDGGALLHGSTLATAQAWQAQRPEEIGQAEAGFIAASAAFRRRGRPQMSPRVEPELAASRAQQRRLPSPALMAAIALLTLLEVWIVNYLW